MPGKNHALSGKLIQVRRREFLFSFTLVLPKHADIARPQIVA